MTEHKMNVVCSAFNRFDLVKEAIELFEEQNKGAKIEKKILLDPGYPLAKQPMHSQSLMAVADKFNWQYMKTITNEGVHGNWNKAMREMNLGDKDVLFTLDPDERPQEPGYLNAMIDVFNHAPEAITVQLSQCKVKIEKLGQVERKIGETWVLDYPRLIAWPMGAYSIKWINRIGGFGQHCRLYGYCEHSTMDRGGMMGAKFYMLRDHTDIHIDPTDQFYLDYKKKMNRPDMDQDPLFVQWKIESAAKTTCADFSEWLKGKI
jgi:hypothetical protein